MRAPIRLRYSICILESRCLIFVDSSRKSIRVMVVFKTWIERHSYDWEGTKGAPVATTDSPTLTPLKGSQSDVPAPYNSDVANMFREFVRRSVVPTENPLFQTTADYILRILDRKVWWCAMGRSSMLCSLLTIHSARELSESTSSFLAHHLTLSCFFTSVQFTSRLSSPQYSPSRCLSV